MTGDDVTQTRADEAQHHFGVDYKALTRQQQGVIDKIVEKAVISRDLEIEFEKSRDSLGAKLADKLASFGGSWTFIAIFIAFLVAWSIVNGVLLGHRAWDPYPFILLNLFLSMLASLQAPVILMSQNRAAARDRLNAAHDYEVNLKAEMEIQHLHTKIDELQQERWNELIELQKQQLELLKRLAGGSRP